MTLDHPNTSVSKATTNTSTSTTVVLFYKYFVPTVSDLEEEKNNTNSNNVDNKNINSTNDNDDYYYYIQHHEYSEYYLLHLQQYIQTSCQICNITKGRILIASEGINGTISANRPSYIQQFIQCMESLDLIQQFGFPFSSVSTLSPSSTTTTTTTTTGQFQNKETNPLVEHDVRCQHPTEFLFQNIDWKISTTTSTTHNPTSSTTNVTKGNIVNVDPFPDLKISIVKEIISTGGTNQQCNNAGTSHNSSSSSGTTANNNVTNITSSGITIQDMIQYGGGKHLSPTEFHNMIAEDTGGDNNNNNNNSNNNSNVLLFDIRNTFEYQIGHFVNPCTQQAAIHPKDMVQFSTLQSILDQTIFSSSHDTNDDDNNNNNNNNNTGDNERAKRMTKEELRNKKILLYCTGGIRCEKASVMFQKYLLSDDDLTGRNDSKNIDMKNSNNKNNIYQLSGGIHRYIEQYGTSGFFKGKNFVFDQRIVQDPSDYDTDNKSSSNIDLDRRTVTTDIDENDTKQNDIDHDNDNDSNIVGRCIECQTKYDTLCGSRICTVCRDLVLICSHCQQRYREYHCIRHQIWKSCYFTFLEVYTIDELQQHYDELCKLRDGYLIPPPPQQQQQLLTNKVQLLSKKYKNVRRTLYKQMIKVQDRIRELETGSVQSDRNSIRRCRSCFEPNTLCDGKCWGFWKRSSSALSSEEECVGPTIVCTVPMLPVLPIGTLVEPGPHWNEIRYGSKYETIPDENNNTLTTMKKQKLEIPQQEQVRRFRRGRVVDVKTWGSNSTTYDCIAVTWLIPVSSNNTNNNKDGTKPSKTVAAPFIYRWGVIARNGQRMYDLQRVIE